MKGKEEKVLSWADTRKMPLTTRVIQETLRAASILSFTFREAVEDVEFNGEFFFFFRKRVLKSFDLYYENEIFTDFFFFRIFDTKRVEGAATIQKHASQP